MPPPNKKVLTKNGHHFLLDTEYLNKCIESDNVNQTEKDVTRKEEKKIYTGLQHTAGHFWLIGQSFKNMLLCSLLYFRLHPGSEV